MKWKLTIRKEIKVAAALLGLGFLIAFSERKQSGTVISNIVIELENVHENHFLDEADILQLVESSAPRIIGTGIDRLHMKGMESKLKQDAHILDADLFADLKGNLVVNVELRRPVARIVGDTPDAYIAEDGTIMSVSEKYTSRVVLISGPYARILAGAESIETLDQGRQILELIEFITDDPFWKSQVAQLDINSNGEIIIYPQVTGQRVEFGKPENIETKFRKLMIFYKEILPQRGWTKYERVNLKYEGQVIAE